MPVDTSSWREFRVGDLFELERCKCSNATMLGDGDIPYVGATVNNNGIIKYVSDIIDGTWVSEGNCIVFICDGQGSNGYQVYIAPDFIGSTTCKIGRIDGLNELRALFLISVLNLNRSRYSYGYMEKRNMTALSNEVIKLPVTPGGEPDWDYMEQYMKAVMDRQAHVIDSLTRISKEKHPVDVGTWCEFRVGDLFETIKDGKQVPTGSMVSMHDLVKGDVDRITVTDKNNGVVGQYSVDSDVFNVYENFISISFLGSVFYHPGKASLDMKVHCLKPIGVVLNEFTGLFLVAVIRNILHGLDYTNQISSSMLPSLRLVLPVTPGGEPDWSYMEQYMRAVMDRQEHVVRCLARLRG